MKNLKFGDKVVAIIGAIVVIVGILLVIAQLIVYCAGVANNASSKSTITARVTSKEVKRYNGEDKYLIYTKDTEDTVNVFEITDSMIIGRFNSSDIYGTLEVGKTYKFTVVGYRNELMSLYPNICEIEEVTE